MKNIKCCSEDMACKHGIQLCIHIMQSKTQILEHKANTVKEHAPRLRSNARMEIALCKKKMSDDICNKFSFISIYLFYCHLVLQTPKGGIFTNSNSTDTE